MRNFICFLIYVCKIEEFELFKKKLFPLLIWCCCTLTQDKCNIANRISNFTGKTFPTKWALKCNLTKCHCIELQVCSWKSASLHLPTAKLHLSQIIQRCLLFWTFYPEWVRKFCWCWITAVCKFHLKILKTNFVQLITNTSNFLFL